MMVLTTPRRSVALAASILAAFDTAHGQDVRVFRTSSVGSMPVSNPCPIVKAIHAVHDACSAEIQMCGKSAASASSFASKDEPVTMIQRSDTQQDQDPIEALFGFSGMAMPDGLRSMVESDPFLRMAATPPSSPESSSSLMEELFGDFDRMIDGMMDSALQFGNMVAESSGDDNGDLAEATLERMVNSMFDHVVVSASRSQPTQASRRSDSSDSEDSTDEEDDHSQSPRAGSAGDAYSIDGMDPIDMAKRIARRGKIILGEGKENHRQRRRLTEEEAPKAGIRQRLARRLTEVTSPLVGMPARVFVEPLEDGSGMRVMVSQPVRNFLRLPSFLRPSAPVQHSAATPRLMLGFPVENCLWDVHDGEMGVSPQCSASLDNVRALNAQLLDEEEQRENTIMNILNEVIGGEDDFRENATITTSAVYFYRGPCCEIVFWAWMAAFVFAIFACFVCSDDEEEDERNGEYDAFADVYHVLPDDGENSKKKGATLHVYAGIPVQVV